MTITYEEYVKQLNKKNKQQTTNVSINTTSPITYKDYVKKTFNLDDEAYEAQIKKIEQYDQEQKKERWRQEQARQKKLEHDEKIRQTAREELDNNFFYKLLNPKTNESQNSWINKNAQGNFAQKAAATAGDVTLNLIRGVIDAGDFIGDLGSYGVAGVADLLGFDNYAKDVREGAQARISDVLNGVDEKVDEYSLFGEKLDSVISSVGQSYAGGKVGQAFLPNAGNIPVGKLNMPVTAIATGASSSITEAYKNGADNKQALVKGITGGLIEGFSEGIFGVFGQGGSEFEDVLTRTLTKNIENQVMRKIAKTGVSALGEGLEEQISYTLNWIADNGQDVVMNALGSEVDNKMGNKWSWSEFLESGLSGALAGGLSAGATNIGMNRTQNQVEQAIHDTQNSLGRTLTRQEQEIVSNNVASGKQIDSKKLADAIKTDEDVVSALTKERMKESKGKSYQELRKEVIKDLEQGDIDINKINEIIGGKDYQTFQQYAQEIDELENRRNELKKVMDNAKEGSLEYKNAKVEYDALQEQINNYDVKTLKGNLQNLINDKVLQNGLISNSYRESANRSVKYEADLSKYNDKEKTIVQKAIDSGVLNNTRRTHILVDMVAKLASDKGVDFDFTNNKNLEDSGFAIKGKVIDGYVTGNNIALNVESPKALNKIVGHEVTHVLEGTELYDQLKTAIEKYAELKGEYKSRLEETTERYKNVKDADVEKEVVADLVGDYIFNDPKFVQQLSTEQPSLFKKIFNEIKYLCKVVTAGSQEAKQLEKVKKIFEDVYRENSKVSETTKFSKRLGGYYPEIKASTKDVSKLGIKNIRYVKEVIEKVEEYLGDKYLSSEKISKPITNIDTGMKIEVWKVNIKEWFSNKNYYEHLDDADKIKKLSIIDNLAKMVKYGEIRANDAPNYHNPNSPARYYYLEHPITIDGVDYVVNMDIRKVPNTNGRFYIYSIIDNIAQKKVGTVGNQKGHLLKSVPTSGNNIPQTPNNVKSKAAPLIKAAKKNTKLSISEQLENQASKIVIDDIETRDAMLKHFESYLEENNITNPTQKDIDNSLVDLLSYDNDMTPGETAKYKKLYDEVAKEYLDQQDGQYLVNEKTIQGLEDYSVAEVKQLSKNYIQQKLEENDLNDVTIKDIAIHGSRGRGTARSDSDLDVVVEYEGNIREDDLFNLLNEEPMFIDDIQVDINPITESLTDYMERSNEYDQEILAKQGTKYSVSEQLDKTIKDISESVIATVNSNEIGRSGDQADQLYLDGKIFDSEYFISNETDDDFANNELFNDMLIKIEEELAKDGISKRYTRQGEVIYDRQELASKGYDKLLDYLDKKHINYDVSRSTEPGHVPSIYLKDSDGDVILRIANHKNDYNSDFDYVYDERYNTIFNNSDYANWEEKILPIINKQLDAYDMASQDTKYSVSEEMNIEDKINSSMTMEDAKRMIQLAFNDNGIKDWYDGKYQNADEWLAGEGVDEVAMYVENTESSINKYLNPLIAKDSSYDDGDYTLEDIIDAYKNQTLTGTQKQARINLDTSVDTGFVDNKFYAPQNRVATQELYEKASQRVTSKNKEEVYKARADFIIAAHNPNAIENLGLDIKEVNKKLRDWSAYTKEARELSQNLNDGVARQNQWSGLENSSLVNKITVSNEQMESLVKEVKGNSSEWQRDYITSTMLAIDTHIDYTNLTFEFDKTAELHKNNANGDYDYRTDTIRIGDANQNTVAHEMGHYIDHQWSKEIFGNNVMPLSERVYSNNSSYNLTDKQKQFLNNFRDFIKDISDSATLSAKYSKRNGSYWQRNTEVFARFTAEFTEWVKNKATNNRYSYERDRYGNPFGDNFTERQYKEFVKILQEKSMLDTMNVKYSITDNNVPITRTPGDIYGSDIKIQQDASIIRKVQRGQALNPNEISKLTPEDANTTPILPKVNRNKKSDGDSRFASNIKNKTKMLSEEHRELLANEEEIAFYDKVTNEDALNEAIKRLENGSFETNKWFGKASENATAVDVAEGWILLKQYADNNDTDNMVEVAKKLRDIGTKAGQTVQAFNIMSRLTPEGMVKYAQSELMEAYDKMVKGQTQKWIDENKNKFDLQPDEVRFIMDTMKEVSTMEDGYDKRVKLAEIQKLMTDKLPPAKGAGIKSWMRISMLFNPKTQVRNVAGNAIIAPVNYFGDMFASAVDKQIAKKTGVRTTGTTNISKYTEGFKEGLYQSYNDFKKGINTRNIEGNRFEIGEGRSFKNTNSIGRSLNRVDSLLSFMLDAGDRGFYEAAFTNSINNQMVLNGTSEVTQEMIDIATQEALSRTWQDNNSYTKFVLDVRRGLNNIKIANYGLGDILIPFAKTPANLTKAIVDYSPLGLVNSLMKGKQLKNAIETGQFTPQMQHKFVQDLGKATAGSMLYVLGVALAQAGITSGESDEDKDVANFLKNTLGVSSYSIKIGDMSFTYDWAQPIAAPLTITANIVNAKDNKEIALLEAITSSLDSAGSTLLEQSFLQSINDVLSNNDGVVSGLITEVLELPSRAIPTLLKQIVDLTDSTQRQTYIKNQPAKSALFYAMSKVPGLSKGLAPQVDTLGRDIQRYGGKNNIFNVFFNPANVNTENISEAAQEIFDVYNATGDKTVMPRVVDYTYKNKQGVTIPITTHQRAELQRETGQIVEKNVLELMNNNIYNDLSDEDKAAMLTDIVNYSYNIAKHEVLGTEVSQTYSTAYIYSKIGNISDYYLLKLPEFTADKDEDGNSISGSKKEKVINYIDSLPNLNRVEKAIMVLISNNSLKNTQYENYDEEIVAYIRGKDLSEEDYNIVFTKLGYIYKNGRVYTK